MVSTMAPSATSANTIWGGQHMGARDKSRQVVTDARRVSPCNTRSGACRLPAPFATAYCLHGNLAYSAQTLALASAREARLDPELSPSQCSHRKHGRRVGLPE